VGQFAKKQIGSHSFNMNRFAFGKHGQEELQLLRFLVVLTCLFFVSCRSEPDSVESPPTSQGPSVISNNPDAVVESWEYISPRSEEAFTSFPSSDPEAVKFGSELDETYIVWRKGGFDLIWGNVICSTQPILTIEDTTIELWLNDGIWEDCEAAETIHAFKVELETDIPTEGWTYVVHQDAPPSFDTQDIE
jgi:hypothetical protein